MKTKTQANIVRSTFTALFAALICVGCFISIPMPGGVPITVQNMFCILAACLLGGIQGAGSVGIFIVLGAIGVPVFSGVTGGMGIIAGPTGGFIIGYFLAAIAAGIIAGHPSVNEKKFSIKNWARIALAALAGYVIIYLPGIPWFIMVMGQKGKEVAFAQALQWTLIPFIPGDLIKLVVTIPLAAVLRPVAARYLYPDDDKEAQELIDSMKKKAEK